MAAGKHVMPAHPKAEMAEPQDHLDQPRDRDMKTERDESRQTQSLLSAPVLPK